MRAVLLLYAASRANKQYTEYVFRIRVRLALHEIVPLTLNIYRRGEVAAIVQRIIMNMKIRQMVAGNNPPELIGEHVECTHVLLTTR